MADEIMWAKIEGHVSLKLNFVIEVKTLTFKKINVNKFYNSNIMIYTLSDMEKAKYYNHGK